MNKIHFRALSPSSGLLHRGKRRRGRGRNYARTEPKLSNFSKDEEELIFKLHALLGNRWSLIAGRLPGRTDKEVMMHWETYLKRKLIKMGIDPTNHRLYHHTHYMTRRHLNSSHKQHENNILSDQSSSSVSESCGVKILPIESTNCSEVSSSSTGKNRLPDLNISLIPVKTSFPAHCLQDCGSRSQETLVLFR